MRIFAQLVSSIFIALLIGLVVGGLSWALLLLGVPEFVIWLTMSVASLFAFFKKSYFAKLINIRDKFANGILGAINKFTGLFKKEESGFAYA